MSTITPSDPTMPKEVEVLVLGSGWTSTFLIPMLTEKGISYASTSRAGSKLDTITFTFDAELQDPASFRVLPRAQTIVIMFPIKGEGASTRLVQGYESVHGSGSRWIQLGSTGIWDGARSQGLTSRKTSPWVDRHTPANPTHPRFIAEKELLALSGKLRSTTVLNLAGLHGYKRTVRSFLFKVAASKEQLASKGSVHFVEGRDVARAIILLHNKFTPGERWILTDLRVYDWWSLYTELLSPLSPDSEAANWVLELMAEHGVRSLPRPIKANENGSLGSLTRALDGSEFWKHMGEGPSVHRID